ncbi:putative Diguanylate cyclase (GGDEF) domain-containing protein [Rhodospirillaceae bacterium LM-1]|nr:putative Diguanylate cyclase (GGDEF) domain-containing protein [Rhodospirillaceae bacterium LM-1]
MEDRIDHSGLGGFRTATLIYAGALALIATLSMVTHVMVDAIVQRQEATARVVNISGRQRMLSQRIPMLALEISRADSAEARALYKAEMQKAIDMMAVSHDALADGSQTLNISAEKSAEVAALYNAQQLGLNGQVASYLLQARQFLALPEEDMANSSQLNSMLAASHGPILEALDKAVRQYETESETAIRHLRQILLALVGVMLATLSAEAIFVFRPLFRKLEIAQSKLLDAARTDPLTGCWNRRFLMDAALREAARKRRTGATLSVMMLDIDHFKKINDSYGHAVGDDALLVLVNAILPSIRASDLLGRLGGEEFAILLPETALDQACQVAEKLRENIAAAQINGGETVFSMTVSIGVADMLPEEDDFLLVLERADKALYAAKKNGRNRVVRFTPELAQAPGKGF